MSRVTQRAGELFGRLKGAAKEAVEGYGGIFRRLTEEHGEMKAVMKRISVADDSQTRGELFPQLRRQLLSHARAEQREFYPVLKQFEQTRELAERGEKQHEEIETMLEQLHRSDASHSSWTETFTRMMHAVESHVQMEERDLFPRAKQVLTKKQMENVDKRFEGAKTSALRSLG